MKSTYILFIDESGVGNFNHPGKYFVLGTILIKKEDCEIIEGYLKMLKRKYLDDDLKIVHSTDLFERPYRHYRKLLKPKRIILKFIKELKSILSNVPYQVGIYYVDKNKARLTVGYTPAGGRTSASGITAEQPYKSASLQAIKDFTSFLVKKNAIGEIVIESRQNSDTQFVTYFDESRKHSIRGVINPLAKETNKRINSLLIANKRILNGGLEIADICSYITYRKLYGDPTGMMKINMGNITLLYNAIVKNVYVRGSRKQRIKEVII